MAEDKKNQIEEQLQDEQLDEVNGGGTMRDIHSIKIIRWFSLRLSIL